MSVGLPVWDPFAGSKGFGLELLHLYLHVFGMVYTRYLGVLSRDLGQLVVQSIVLLLDAEVVSLLLLRFRL